MNRIYVPTRGPEDWRALLADPDKHWVSGYSAKTLAYAWETQSGYPIEIARVLNQHPALEDAEPLLIFPEWKVPLPGGARPSQNDIWTLAKGGCGLISIAVEGKVEEPFDKTVGEWRADASPGKTLRLKYLAETLGLDGNIPDGIRYQLLHRTASALIEARRFCARDAVMLVHSFSDQHQWFQDFADFVALFGTGVEAEVNRLVSAAPIDGISLHLGWVHGERRTTATP